MATTNMKSTLEDIQLYEEEGQYYLRLRYIVEDEYAIKELEIPKARIPLDAGSAPEVSVSNNPRGHVDEAILNTGFGYQMELRAGETKEANHVYYTVKTLQAKPKEMTVSEIEKKLGYKVKIISEG